MSNRPRKGVLLFGEDHHVIPLRRVEKITIWNAIIFYEGNLSVVSEKLKVPRSTLYRKVQELGLKPTLEKIRKKSSNEERSA